ncbi:heme-binding protein [Ochrobactrum sp. BTU1]|uniref:heme-binding protein n=1 Tax=Ochrobactrum sp. BTU1 TaxID=2840456 RepID=UPI001C0459AA|nr:heme-binding protein [Ochrobactrum sp. BTU1]
MTCLKQTLSASHHRQMIETSISKGNALNVPCSTAVIGTDGLLLSFERRDDAISGSVELAIKKAFAAQISVQQRKTSFPDGGDVSSRRRLYR